MSFKEETKDVISDEEIVELFWQRNEQAIKETDAKYGKFLFRIAYNILHDTNDCEECQNDTYLAVWNAIPPNRPNPYSVFIARIMRNNAIDQWFYMGDTLEAIASRLKIHVSTVQREAERIKKGLKEFLERNGVYV